MKYRFRKIEFFEIFVLQIQRDTGEWEDADEYTTQIVADILNGEVPTI